MLDIKKFEEELVTKRNESEATAFIAEQMQLCEGQLEIDTLLKLALGFFPDVAMKIYKETIVARDAFAI